MYVDFFNLRTYPFQVTPDAEFLYLGKAHARAKAYLDYAVWSPDGFVVITGEIGSGKTILLKKVVSELPESVVVANIFQTQLDEIEFLQALLLQFGYRAFDAKKIELLDALNSFLLEQHQNKRQVVLIVDEAQNLTERALEEIRLLSGLESQAERILKVILVGQAELGAKLDSPGLEQLAQRVQLRFHIKALSRDEIGTYIKHRLTVAGAQNPALFPADTVPLIHRYTDGVPRLINILCDTTLTGAFVESTKNISTELIAAALEELQWVPYAERISNKRRNVEDAHDPSDNGISDELGNGLLDSTEMAEKLNRLYTFVPKLAANITGKMKSIDQQLKQLTELVKDKRSNPHE
jgi:type II secretory pathway predicted ATPase ExeA